MNFYTKYWFLVVFGMIISLGTYSQVPSFGGIKSPNVGSLSVFGNIPVSYYTGTPDISIPIYTVKSGTLSIPISLRYHPANVKPNEHPGWVGLGWNLDAGGVITRVTHGIPDEANNTALSYLKSYYNVGNQELSDQDWYSNGKLLTYYKAVNDSITDFEADEFFFNFPGGSGKFIFLDGEWKVISDQNIEVELDTFLSKSEVQFLYSDMDVTLTMNATDISRYFKGFILKTEDGTKYYFGGDKAIEFSGPISVGSEFFVAANAWHLKRIVDTHGNEIEFSYKMSYPVCKISYYVSIGQDFINGVAWSHVMFNGWRPRDNSFPLEEQTAVDTTYHMGVVVIPVYLDSITSKNSSGTIESLRFTKSISEELRYSDGYFLWFKNTVNNESRNRWDWLRLKNDTAEKASDPLKWEKLDKIQIFDPLGNVKQSFDFAYNNTENERLSLASLTETGEYPSPEKMYNFEYEPGFDPAYGGDYTDHWGYYNATSIVGSNNFYMSKESNPGVLTYGILNRIVYPTGGSTEFEWEPNQYSKVVSTSRDNLITKTGSNYTGGVRIREIRNYIDSLTPPITKKYSYVLNNNGTESSGILNGISEYRFVDTRPLNYHEPGINPSIEFDIQTFNDIASHTYNANGSHVGYSEVTEENGDGSYTRYVFTNYGPDSHGGNHFDIKPLGSIGWVDGEDKYLPMSSLERERGKLLSKEEFKNNGSLVDKTEYYYDNSVTRLEANLNRFEARNKIGTNDAFLLFAAALKEFTYRYNLVKELHASFDTNGENPVVSVKKYGYDEKDRIVSISDSTYGDYRRTTVYTTYPESYEGNSFFIGALVDKGVTSVPIERVKVIYENSTNEVVSGVLRTYNTDGTGSPYKDYKLELQDGTPLPFSQFKFSNRTGTGVLPVKAGNLDSFNNFAMDTRYLEAVSYDRHDSVGNLLQYHNADDIPVTYAWGYKGVYPVARFDNLTDSLFRNNAQLKSNVDLLDDYFDLSRESARDSLKTLNISIRSYVPAGSIITTYTYQPLIGVTSKTDLNGKTTYYDYDGFGRLEAVRDDNWDIVESYEFQYKDIE